MLKKKMTTHDLSFIALFAALTAVMAQISIPMPLGVPMTMQTFAISMAGILLGARRGFVSALVYVLLGAVGAPVFAKLSGGLPIIVGPTGGFILSFPLMAWLVGYGAEKQTVPAVVLGLLAGTVVNYICGMIMFSTITGQGLLVAFNACVLPFIPTTVVKIIAACVIGIKIRKRSLVPDY
ncbi:MAG: biotin transporter BioY [Synergistaceae bacterium]|jgi:biotin transport system substrate-specific component|nr:biotin transporter BioY [Synergistaceae bacterium]